MSGVVLVDLDGTLAHYDGWKGIEHIGKPIKPMVQRVKRWLKMGRQVRCFTARVHNDPIAAHHVSVWLNEQGLHKMGLTCMKDRDCVLLLDDRAVKVELNTGRLLNKVCMAKPCR